MYDTVVVGQGLTGLLSAIWEREKGNDVALIAKGTGKVLQSTGLFDLLPGSEKGWTSFTREFALNTASKLNTEKAVMKFKALMERNGLPYCGRADQLVPVVTGAGHIKWTALYPETIQPIPDKGKVTVIGFNELLDFQPAYVKGNLQRERPDLQIETVSISIGRNSGRPMTQLDVARLLDQTELRLEVVQRIETEIQRMSLAETDLFILPSVLGVKQTKKVLADFRERLNGDITEAPGMPPNASAVRLYETLRTEAIRCGVRFYHDTTVTGCECINNRVTALLVHNSSNQKRIEGHSVVLATGGILGGGLEVTEKGYKETVLRLETDSAGVFKTCPENVYPIGASNGLPVIKLGITGGMYSLLSTYEAVELAGVQRMGGVQNA